MVYQRYLFKKIKPEAFSKLFFEGFTIIETLVAIFVVIVGIGAIFSLLVRIHSMGQFSFSRLTAAYLAQEGIEVVRNIRDTNFLALHRGEPVLWHDNIAQGSNFGIDYRSQKVGLGDDCADKPNLFFDGNYYRCTASSNTQYRRYVSIKKNNLDSDPENTIDSIEVEIKVFWKEKTREHHLTVKEILYNWQIFQPLPPEGD